MRSAVVKAVPVVAATAVAVALYAIPASSSAVPVFNPVHAKYDVNGSVVGAGTVVEYGGQPYIPLGAVSALTGTKVNWDAQTATLSAGSKGTAVKGGTYIEDLPGQPYYVNGAALCWQTSANAVVGPMHSFDPYAILGGRCNIGLSRKSEMVGHTYKHSIAVLVSADNKKTPSTHNTVTMDYDLGGHYLTFSGSAGLVDNPFNRTPMKLTLTGDGRVLGTAVLAPASLPASFKVNVAHVQKLSVEVSNVSGGAPNWQYNYQYDPGAVMIANPMLVP